MRLPITQSHQNDNGGKYNGMVQAISAKSNRRLANRGNYNMKLKCKDGKVRTFTNSELDHTFANYTDVRCTHCGEEFGVHSISAIKDWLREHVCKKQPTTGTALVLRQETTDAAMEASLK